MQNIEQTVAVEQDLNLVELWLRKDPTRWVAGAFAGLFAGLVSMAFAVLLAIAFGAEGPAIWYPVKLSALPFLGNVATAYDSSAGFVVGLVVYEIFCALLGVAYAHLTVTNYFPALLGASFTFGTFTWIFVFNLFIQSFHSIHSMQISPGAAFFVLMVMGLSLASVAFFDRILRGKKI